MLFADAIGDFSWLIICAALFAIFYVLSCFVRWVRHQFRTKEQKAKMVASAKWAKLDRARAELRALENAVEMKTWEIEALEREVCE